MEIAYARMMVAQQRATRYCLILIALLKVIILIGFLSLNNFWSPPVMAMTAALMWTMWRLFTYLWDTWDAVEMAQQQIDLALPPIAEAEPSDVDVSTRTAGGRRSDADEDPVVRRISLMD